MSENTNIDANNLCITEEVFEKFQAESMYEEEELITLSDILPSNGTAAPSVPDDAHDLLTDENVVLGDIQTVTSGIDIGSENVQHSEITTVFGAEVGDSGQLLLETSDFNVSQNIEIQTEVVEEKQPKKRGRQKKKTIQESSLDNTNTEQPEQLQPSRRGRRKKINNDFTNDISIEEQMKLMHEDDPAISNNEPIRDNIGVEENIAPQAPKRRGRKKKLIQEPKIDTSVEDICVTSDKLDSDVNNQNGDNTGLPSRRRGRKKKTFHNDIIDINMENSTLNSNDNNLTMEGTDDKIDASDVLPISQINITQSVDDTLASGRAPRITNKTVTETLVQKNDNTSTKKRGRRKKLQHSLETDLAPSQNDVNSTPSDVSKFEEPSSTVDKPEPILDTASINETMESTIDNDDEADDLSLSNLKQVLISQDAIPVSSKEEIISSTIEMESEKTDNNLTETTTKVNSTSSEIGDLEYNSENIANEGIDKANENLNVETEIKNDVAEGSLLVEDTSRRPTRRKIKQNFRYQEDSDEDPFANIELSDDEPKRGKRGAKYYSDDEYIPGKKRGKMDSTESSQSSDMDLEDLELEGLKKQKRKCFSKKLDSPRKGKGKQKESDSNSILLDVTTVPPASTNTDDIEVCLESSVIKNPQVDEISDNKSTWGNTNEFESFIAQKIQGTDLKIKKVSSSASAPVIAPLDIPTLDPAAKKLMEKSTQTMTTRKNAQGVQTSPPYDIPMKENVALTMEQSEKACEFLNSIVKTTSELGVLMTQKSEDFMKKKIHTKHVTDTFKMDYCVRKSFLLFKLAKHNLLQMEEDLAKQYDEFLKANNLHTHREQVKVMASTSAQKADDNDSDCEIVDVKPVADLPKGGKKNEKSKLNPKTVFLNKELSIKITKKPSDDKKLNIKGRHTVWINDSVILKKVTPTQSFLAQDSRNKKPPDSKVIENIVRNFFRDYERQQSLSICAPFLSTEWLTSRGQYVCNYFVASPENRTVSVHFVNNSSTESVADVNKTVCVSIVNLSSPKSLFSLCTLCIQKHSHCKRIVNQCGNVRKQPQALLELCLHILNKDNNNTDLSKNTDFTNALTLKTICYRNVIELLSVTKKVNNFSTFIPENNEVSIEGINKIIPKLKDINTCRRIETDNNKLKTDIRKLFSLCVEFIQDKLKVTSCDESFTESTSSDMEGPNYCDKTIKNYEPQSLKNITYEKILYLIYTSHESDPKEKSFEFSICEVKTLSKICLDAIRANLYGKHLLKAADMTINSINTLTEEAFLNIEETCTVESAQYQYFDEDSNCYEDEYEHEYEMEEESNSPQDSNWVKQVQMKEFKSCLASNMSNSISESTHNEPLESLGDTPSEIPFMVNIKSEPLEEELVENSIEPVNVKTEPTQIYNELTIALEHVATKAEPDNSNVSGNSIQRSASYDGDAFEDFVATNKMMQSIENTSHNEEIFSQSALRIRRQFDPDWDDENDANMSLLVPHTYEPLQITEAKDTLMQSSSDEGNKDVSSKKKVDKRKKKTKKVEIKSSNKDTNTVTTKNKTVVNHEVETKSNRDVSNTSKIKVVVNNEVAVLTRRMRERIRQEEKKVQSSDSENEQMETRSKTDKKKGKVEEAPDTSKKSQKKKYEDTDIQCNNVDSTEQVDTISDKTGKQKESVPTEIFTGFSAVDQTEINTYQKYLKNVYKKILPKIDGGDDSQSKDESTCNEQFNTDEPIEYLECEPTLPIFERGTRKRSSKKNAKTLPNKKVPEKVVLDAIIPENIDPESREQEEKPVEKLPVTEPIQIIDRHGWQCYPIDVNDRKLYDDCHIILDKLPETFVEMYFQYQDITDRNKEDKEVDRLTNLQSLNRTSTVKDLKSRIKKAKTDQVAGALEPVNDLDGSRPGSPASNHYHELTPSEDDESDREEETLASIEKPATENNMAKSSLMDDHSDTDTDNVEGKLKKIKEEPNDDVPKEDASSESPKRKPGPKSKTKQKQIDVQKPAEHPDLMLTADKMMNKELTLLHAPINLDDNVPQVPAKKPATRGRSRNSSKKEIHYRIKNEDDSSSEEEKQWVTTKEKLLKRLEKKQETTLADEAKRTKIVSEYIERRGENPELRLPQRRRGRRSNKKFLERQKQLRVLTRELLGDAADSAHHKKGYNQGYFKGRRNIRKVIDKKSLARSTVMANMEEFERKRRLNMKQARLREQLGCDEGVNVLVINDELCLEYDFEQQQPVVSVHPFFTKIMKAHQYEGVKFMWDACFESLSQLAAGHPGGGCILAHCMGLGKTLQVLALLHTVLTHPGAGMQRVLVCCPLSTVLNWVDEIHKWIGPVTDQIKVFELSKLKKTYERAYQLEDWYSGGGIFIIGYELFRSLTTLDAYLDDIRPTIVKKIRTALLDPGPDIIVCDEGHLLKNDCSVLAVAMSRVVTKRRIVLTGTPMQNNLREYYCMVNFVKPNLLGTYSEYSNRFENPIMNGQHRDSSEEDIKLMKARTHILHKVLEGCLQRQEASVLYPYLPKKHEYTVFISLTTYQWDMYKYYLSKYASKTKNSVLKDFHILQKIWSHPQVLHHFHTKARDVNSVKVKSEKLEDDLAEEEQAAPEDIKPNDTDIWWLQFLEDGAMLDSLESSNKFVVVFRILDECIKLGDKVLIFSTSLFTMDTLEFFLRKINKWSLGQEYYRLDGSVPAEVRQKWCREFNAENNLKTKLFLMSTRAGSLGLNMTAANRVIILDTSWNPAHDIQSIFRVYRFGQKKDCYIYRLVALGTMEQKIYERSVTKQAVACRVVDEQQIDRHYNMQELTELYRFDESGSCVESGVAAGVRDVALLRVARLRALHAVHEHDSLLRGSEPALPEHERQAAWSQFQQEHENGQLENNEKVKKISAVKRTYNKTATSTAVKTEPGGDDCPDFKPRETKAKRGRKSANVEPEGESILPDPDTDKINTLDPNTEQSMVRKITELLVKHNFKYKDAQAALPQLVLNVRRIVMSGQDIGCCDALTANIARVLMQRQDNMSMPLMNGIIGESINQTMPGRMPPDTQVHIPDPPIKTTKPGRSKSKPGPKCRKGYVYEEIPSTSTAPENVPLFDRLLLPNESDGRTKRKAALAAEKLLDTAVEDGVIDLDDDDVDYDSGTDSAPETEHTEKIVQEKAKNTSPTPQVTINENRAKVPKKSKTSPEELEVLEDVIDTSILLSDDEERILSTTAVELEPEEEISVHPSLLKNYNFIKIVAHTYLEGNPMLDEDAAMLAARYSTYKAVKELETTGKPINSGPIYDIAVQVLGKSILKKLQNTNHKVDTTDDTQSALLVDLLAGGVADNIEEPTKTSDQNQKATVNSQSQKTEKPDKTKPTKVPEQEKGVDKPKKKPGPRRKKRIYIESDDDSDTPVVSNDLPNESSQNRQSVESGHSGQKNPSYLSHVMSQRGLSWPPGESDVTPTQHTPTHSQGVVPVGLFKTTVSVASPSDAQAARRDSPAECILPDDDVIVSDAPPAVPSRTNVSVPQLGSTAMPPQPGQLPRGRRGQPIVLKMVRATNHPHDQPANLNYHLPMLVPAAQSTICLDSDDEDVPNPTPNIPQQSLTRASSSNPALNYSHMAPDATIAGQPVRLRMSKVDPSKFVLTTKKKIQPPEPMIRAPVVDTANQNVRYIVIPKSQVGQMYPPLVSIPPEQIPPNHMIQTNPNGTFTLHAVNQQAGLAPSNIIPQAEPVNSNVFTHTSSDPRQEVAPTATVSTGGRVTRRETRTATPVSTPNLSIDSGRILRNTQDRNTTRLVAAEAAKPATPVTPAKPSTPSTQTTPAKPAERPRKVSSSSDSDSSQSETNDDPLSILKDVVHIQADSYEGRTPTKTPKKADNVSASNKVNSATKTNTSMSKIQTQKDTHVKNTPAAPVPVAPSNNLRTRMFVDSVDLTFNDDEPDETSSTAAKTPVTTPKLQTLPSKTSSTSKSQPAVTKSQPTVTKSQTTVIKSQPTTSKCALATSKVGQTAVKPAPAATSSKTSQSNSNSKVKQPATAISQPAAILNKPSTSNQPASKKRVAPVDTALPKKKKVDHLMTLKDFDIDDIDDIIELD